MSFLPFSQQTIAVTLAGLPTASMVVRMISPNCEMSSIADERPHTKHSNRNTNNFCEFIFVHFRLEYSLFPINEAFFSGYGIYWFSFERTQHESREK